MIKICKQCSAEYETNYADSFNCDKCRLKYRISKLRQELNDALDLFKGRYGEKEEI